MNLTKKQIKELMKESYLSGMNNLSDDNFIESMDKMIKEKQNE